MKAGFIVSVLSLALVVTASYAAETGAPPRETVLSTRPLGVKVSVKMVSPCAEPADLQIICLFKHKDSGDTYRGAAKETDERLGGLLSALRNRGEFVGEAGETILFTPPKGSIAAKRFMVIGLGEEKGVSLETLWLAGRIAAREAVRLEARHVAWAPVIRDEGVTTIDVAKGDRAFVEQLIGAYDTEKRLQAQGLAPQFSIEDVVIEAGPTYFDGAVRELLRAVESASSAVGQRDAAPYISGGKTER